MREFYKKNTVAFPTAADPQREVSDHYGVNGIPTTVIYDRKGKIAAQIVGERTEQQFLRLLRKAGLR
jgi:thioredoxin-related protein